MPQLEPKPTPFIPGMFQLDTEDLNQLLRLSPRQVKSGENARVDYYGDRIIVAAKDQHVNYTPDVANYVRQFVVLEDYDDILLCTPYTFAPIAGSANLAPPVYDPKTGQNTIPLVWVAKPYLLQKTPWDGNTVIQYGTSTKYDYTSLDVRNAILGNTVQAQDIEPGFFPGDIITAVQCQTGYMDPTNSFSVVWQDLNTAARIWSSGGSQGSFIGSRYYALDILTLEALSTYTLQFSSIAGYSQFPGVYEGSAFIDTSGFLQADKSSFLIPVTGMYEINFNAGLTQTEAVISYAYIAVNITTHTGGNQYLALLQSAGNVNSNQVLILNGSATFFLKKGDFVQFRFFLVFGGAVVVDLLGQYTVASISYLGSA